ncbi:MAG: hypothetical protein AB2708_09075 [Candidatus Thiodiazotropha taylori]
MSFIVKFTRFFTLYGEKLGNSPSPVPALRAKQTFTTIATTAITTIAPTTDPITMIVVLFVFLSASPGSASVEVLPVTDPAELSGEPVVTDDGVLDVSRGEKTTE